MKIIVIYDVETDTFLVYDEYNLVVHRCSDIRKLVKLIKKNSYSVVNYRSLLGDIAHIIPLTDMAFLRENIRVFTRS